MESQIIDATTGEISEGNSMDIHPVAFDAGNYKLAIAPARANLAALREFVHSEFKTDVDFGPPFPGSDKKSLLLPGAEKFNLLFSARPRFITIKEVTNFDNGFCLYHLGCELVHKQTGVVIGYGEGSCNSYESKFRYRNAERLCPVCKKNAIIKGKAEYGGGWLCFGKKGGCGAKFSDDDNEIIGQEVGRVENDNLFDIWNTILKQAEKRAMVAAVVYTGGVSELFTQDEDDFEENEAAKPKKTVATKPAQSSKKEPAKSVEPDYPEPEPMPEQAQPQVDMVEWFGGKSYPAKNLIDIKTINGINEKFVGAGKVISAPAHLKNHLRTHFQVDRLQDMTWEKAKALIVHCRGEGDDPRWYAAKEPVTPEPAKADVVEDAAAADATPSVATTPGETATDNLGVDLNAVAFQAFVVAKYDDLTPEQKAQVIGALDFVAKGVLTNTDIKSIAELAKLPKA